MRVLVACEFSGVVRDAFLLHGYDAISCDLLPTITPGPHIQGNVLNILHDNWDLMIAHPPCTYLSYAGGRWWNYPGRIEKRQQAMIFFMTLVNAPIPYIAIENPRGFPIKAYRLSDQVIEPYYFGEKERKRTHLWLKNLPPLMATYIQEKPSPAYIDISGQKRYYVDKLPSGDKRRSVTFPGIAEAMAKQWGDYVSCRLGVQKG